MMCSFPKIQFFYRAIAAITAAVILAASATASQAAKVVASVDLSKQRMVVTVNGLPYARWKVSTGAGRFRTPTGAWSAKWLSKHHRSRKYNNAPMPYAIFFNRGYAVHGTDQVRRLGRPASHGCIRLHPRNAAKLFELTQRFGLKNTLIKIKQ